MHELSLLKQKNGDLDGDHNGNRSEGGAELQQNAVEGEDAVKAARRKVCVGACVCVMKYRARTYVYMLYFNAGEYTCINVCVYACIHPATGLGTVCDSIVFVA